MPFFSYSAFLEVSWNNRIKTMGEFPNKATQFSSTNQPPGERKTHGLRLKTLIRNIFEEEYTDELGNKTVRAIKGLKAVIKKFEEGDVSAFKALSERLEGMPTQKIEQDIKHTNFFENIANKAESIDS